MESVVKPGMAQARCVSTDKENKFTENNAPKATRHLNGRCFYQSHVKTEMS